MTEHNAETALLAAIDIDQQKISAEALKWAREYINHNECGLAYDILVGEISRSSYSPSTEALALIKFSAAEMGIVYPAMSC
jgi:hypothetical protein